MKSVRVIWSLLIFLFNPILWISVPSSSVETTVKEKFVILLHDGWQFKEAGEKGWNDAEVPGCVHTDLLRNKLIEDPFYGANEQKLQWIGKTDWEYQTIFSIEPHVLEHANIELVFQGLDTYATVYLNGVHILETDNMFREWRVGCKKELKVGNNKLKVYFHSPINRILPVMYKLNYQLPASNDQGEKTSPFTRKAPYHFGWDWGPRFVTCGIWQSVFLEIWDHAKIVNLNIKQNQINKQNAQLTAVVEVQSSISTEALLIVKDKDASFNKVETWITLKPGTNKVSVDFEIRDPDLWWPNGMGEQPLYTIEAILSINGKRIDQTFKRIGLRSVELRQESDQWGKSFEFVINDVPVFAKGGNWIPADNFINRVTKDRYYHLVKSCKDANMNMLRVWGGGIYEKEEFYELCDEMGIMVWQDFMFACSMYPGDEDFLENVEQEAIYQVKRLRDHPSIVLWCGNNEMETAWFHWGWKEQLPPQVWDDYKKIFHEILPEICSKYDPSRSYWPSSPSSNLEADANSQETGDVHYWGVWHAAEPFEAYEKQFPRFNSEYGFQSFPNSRTVNYYACEKDQYLESPVMIAHQKHPRGNQLIQEYMLRHYPEPKDFTSFLYLSQVLQAEGIKIGAEHLRRIMPCCMGSLYWQINDCWPVASWSGIDYFGRWKALHYYARKFYNDILVSPNAEEGEIEVYIVSDRRKAVEAQLIVSLIDFEGTILRKEIKNITIIPRASQIYFTLQEAIWLEGIDQNSTFLYLELLEDGKSLSTNKHFFAPTKKLLLPKPEIHFKMTPSKKGIKITLTSNKLARNVYLSTDRYEGFFTYNYFDIIPGRPVEIEFQPNEPINVSKFRQVLKIMSLVDAFENLDN